MKHVYGLVLICYSVVASAQLTREEFVLSSRGLLDIQAGVSVPVFDYALSKPTLPAGYAQTGYTYRIAASYDALPYLGVAIQYQYCNNPFNSTQFQSDLQSANPDVTITSMHSNPWELRTTMFGVYYPFKSYRSSIDLRFLAGLCAGTLPENEVNITDPQTPNAPYHFKDLESKASAFGFQAGIKMRYQLYKNLMFCLAADYTQTKIEFTDIRRIETNRNITFTLEPYTQKFQMVNITAGIGIKFE